MQCPVCKTANLTEWLAKNGVVVDVCPQCKGIWLDRGEIYLFSKQPQKLEQLLAGGLTNARPIDRHCPRCTSTMNVGQFPNSRVEIDQCPQCEGYWLDRGELSEILNAHRQMLELKVDSMQNPTAFFEAQRKKFPALSRLRNGQRVVFLDGPAGSCGHCCKCLAQKPD